MGRGTRTRLDVAPLIVPPAGPVGGGVGLFGVKPLIEPPVWLGPFAFFALNPFASLESSLNLEALT